MDDIKIYKTGGFVRDEIMGLKSKDIDYSVVAPSFDAMRNYILSLGREIFLETPEYVTIRARVGREAFDYVLARKDNYYSDGRHPDSIEPGTLYDDLARRDFTMNAIAIDEQGNYIDPFNGIQDIKNKLIRCVGKAEDRIYEDYLRLVRAARFSITKNMMIDPEISDMFTDRYVLNKIADTVSSERIREELAKMFEFDTLKTISFFGKFSEFAEAVFIDGIWLKPTSEKR